MQCLELRLLVTIRAMPELPEVETTRRSLADKVQGARILDARLGLPLRWPLGIEVATLRGSTLGGLRRRGKYLWFELDGGVGGGLLLHLGMSGSLAWLGVHGSAGKHDHFELITHRGVLRLTDPRRFGAVVWSASLDQAPAARLLASLGPEPFDPVLDAKSFHTALKHHRAPVKSVLLSGKVIVGAGNIYACEALFMAGIHPGTVAERLSGPRAARLLEALRTVLARAIEAGGTTLRDYRSADGTQGAFQNEAQVYGREGLPCVTCSTPVRRIVIGQRATFFCARCQRRA